MRTAGPAPAVSWRKPSRKRPRCPFVSYKPPAAPRSEGTRRGGAARPEEAAEEGLPAAPGSPRRSGPLGPHACPPAQSEPQVWGRRGAPLGEWAGGAPGAMCERGREAGGGGLQAGSGSGTRQGHGQDPGESRTRSGSGEDPASRFWCAGLGQGSALTWAAGPGQGRAWASDPVLGQGSVQHLEHAEVPGAGRGGTWGGSLSGKGR